MQQISSHSQNLIDEKINALAQIFPEAITESFNDDGELIKSVDFDILRRELSNNFTDSTKQRYSFTWPEKNITVNQAMRPTTKTLRPLIDKSAGRDGTQGIFDSENIYIEGDNLDALKILHETYLRRVKLIYIDPPYNTGKDFIYADNFTESQDEYKESSGQVDDEGNRLVQVREGDGRFHTKWLNMIYPRLKIARDLLTEDGVIFISIDDNEAANLRKICDEIFGEKNFIAQLVWNLGTGTTAGHFTRGHEYIVVYAKNISILDNFANYEEGQTIIDRAVKRISSKNPAVTITFPAGFEFEGKNAVFTGEIGESEKEYILSDEMRFKDGKLVEPTTLKAGFAMRNQVLDFIAGREVIDSKGQKVIKFFFNKKGILFYEKEKTIINPKTVLTGIANTKNGTDEIIDLFNANYFSFPKPSALIQYLIQLTTDDDSIILDFFSGSATTAHAVMSLNAQDGGSRKFILVQIPESTPENSEAFKAGYKTICDIGQERIKRAARKIRDDFPLTTSELDTGFRAFKVDSSNIKDVYLYPDQFKQETLELLADNIKPDRTPDDLLINSMLRFGVPLSAAITKKFIFGKKIYLVEHDDSPVYITACFDENLTEDVITEIAKLKPVYAIFRDNGIISDSLMTNFDQIFNTYSHDTIRRVI